MIISFTGHRPQKIGCFNVPNATSNYICEEIEKKLLKLKPEKCLSGMAIGTDIWAARICVKLDIPFVAVVPFIGQETLWDKKEKDEYDIMLKLAGEVKIVSPGKYAPWKMMARNEFLVDNCDELIAVWNGRRSGTGNCVAYAKSVGKKIHIIDPHALVPVLPPK